jgi:hypothetical protein
MSPVGVPVALAAAVVVVSACAGESAGSATQVGPTSASVEHDADDVVARDADVPELPGCMSQGRTVDAALRNVKEAISLYLEESPRGKRGGGRPVLVTTVEV